MADFQMEGLRRAQRPLVVMVSPWWYSFAAVRLAPGDARATLASIEALWERYEPVRPMSYTFLDENLAALYQTEAQLATAVGAFAALALVARRALQAWRDSFAYRVDLSPAPLLAAGLLARGSALGTVGTQAWRAATSDPVKALQHE